MLTTVKRRSLIEPCDHFGNFPAILQRIYLHRGVQSEEETNYSLSKLLSPQKLLNITAGVALIYRCMQQNQRILIVGDFDADGATSTALFIRTLHSFGFDNVQYLVPNRFKFGYGLTAEIVAVAIGYEPALIITVDNGISSIEGVAAAKAHGIDVLVTDHHFPGDALPDADVIINPNQPHDEFPSKHLAGVGVVFYVLLALRAYLREQNWFSSINLSVPNLAQFLDIVAVGTIADVVKLDFNNRILVEQGLRRIRASKGCEGIRALLAIAGRNLAQVSAADVGFTIGPRLNAAGRLEDMSLGIECLLTDSDDHANKYAKQLNELNEERKKIEQQMQAQALQELSKSGASSRLDSLAPRQFGIAVFDPAWHQGVVGIVAARLKEKFHRPTIVFAQANATDLKGSARSIEGLHIRDALALVASRYPKLITTFGGHAMAAGLSIPIENFENFASIFNLTIEELVCEDQLNATLFSDGELQDSELSLELAETLFAAGPWGQGFPEPVFDGVFTVNNHRIVGERHLKLNLTQAGGQQKIDAIAFNVDRYDWHEDVTKVHIAYQLSINDFRRVRSPQLVVQFLQPTHA